MMNSLYGNSDFNDLLQESYLTLSSLLSGIEFLVKANVYDNKDGLFYSSFFNLSIGIERFLKIALVSEYMYKNNFNKPDNKFLKDKGHNLIDLFNSCGHIVQNYQISIDKLDHHNKSFDLFNFLSSYATKNRYQNLDKLTNRFKEYDNHPIHEWVNISQNYLTENLKNSRIERELLQLYQRNPQAVGFTYFLDFYGNPLLQADMIQYQYIIQRARPYILNDLINRIKPIYEMLCHISLDCNNGPNSDLSGLLKLPYYGELFPIFYAELQEFKTIRNWIHRYA